MARKPRTKAQTSFDFGESLIARIAQMADTTTTREGRAALMARIDEESSLTRDDRIALACGTRERRPRLAREDAETMHERIAALDHLRATHADAVAVPVLSEWVLRMRTAERVGAGELVTEASAIADEAEAHAAMAEQELQELRSMAPRKRSKSRKEAREEPIRVGGGDSLATIERRASLYLRAVLAVVYGWTENT